MREICSKLTIKRQNDVQERRGSGMVIVHSEQILHNILVLPLLTLKK